MSNNNSKRKKTHIPSDFKRRKAKVGKRALLAANVTDTSFQAVSVQVKSQSIKEGASKGILLSGRGRSITELSQQLHHPAGAVRLSAVRGLVNLIDATIEVNILAAHLSVLLPIISKCACVDEEENVRSMGITALHLILSRTIGKNTGDEKVEKLWNSFIPLVAAFVTSALHSLDRPTRLDGSRAVEMISRFLSLDIEIVSGMLPAYITLLQDYGHYHPQRETRKKSDYNNTDSQKVSQSQKTYNNEKKSKRLILLQSLVYMLNATKNGQSQDMYVQSVKPGVVFTCNNSSSTHTHLILEPQREMKDTFPLPHFNNLEAFGNFISNFADEAQPDKSISNNMKREIAESTLENLFSKLRDIFVEISERAIQVQRNKKLFGRADLEELSLLFKSIHLLSFFFAKKPSTIISQLWNMMIQSIPIRSRSPNDNDVATTVNGIVCSAVIEMGMSGLPQFSATTNKVNSSNISKQWINVVLDCLLPRLDANEFHTASTTMNVLSQILVQVNQKVDLIEDNTYTIVIDRISETYFSSRIKNNIKIARSAGARKAVELSTFILQNNGGFKLHNKCTTSIIKFLPHHLMSYRDNFLPDSARIVEALLRFVNRIPLSSFSQPDEKNSNGENIEITNLLDILRKELVSLFELKMNEPSIFQLYPKSIQHKLICLVVALQSPPSNLLQSLGKICAGAGSNRISHDLASFIVETIYLTRRTVSIQTFLGFIIATIGVPKLGKNIIDINAFNNGELGSGNLTIFDTATRRASRIFRRCGTAKILPMTSDIFYSWLVSADDKLINIYRFRICLLLMSVFASDIEDFAKIVPKLSEILVESCVHFLKRCTWKDGTSKLFRAFEYPLVILFQNQSKLLRQLVQQVSIIVEKDKVDSFNILCALHEMIQNPDLADAIRMHDTAWLEASSKIISKVSDGSNLHKAQVIQTCLQLVVGGEFHQNQSSQND